MHPRKPVRGVGSALVIMGLALAGCRFGWLHNPVRQVSAHPAKEARAQSCRCQRRSRRHRSGAGFPGGAFDGAGCFPVIGGPAAVAHGGPGLLGSQSCLRRLGHLSCLPPRGFEPVQVSGCDWPVTSAAQAEHHQAGQRAGSMPGRWTWQGSCRASGPAGNHPRRGRRIRRGCQLR